MTEPIDKFVHDAAQYIYQIPNVVIVNSGTPLPKPFELNAPEKSKKSKKDLEKEKQKKKGQAKEKKERPFGL